MAYKWQIPVNSHPKQNRGLKAASVVNRPHLGTIQKGVKVSIQAMEPISTYIGEWRVFCFAIVNTRAMLVVIEKQEEEP